MSSTYSTISSMLFICGVLLIIATFILYFKLDIYHVRQELNGRLYKRQAKRLKKQYTPNVEGPTTGSFYNNSLSEFVGQTTGTTGSFGNSPTGSFLNPDSGVSLDDLGLIDQEEYKTGILDEDDVDYEDTQATLNNRYYTLIILEESTNISL